MGAKSSSRNGARPTLIAVHTNEGDNPPFEFPDRGAENLAGYLDRPDVRASYHRIVDDDSAVTYLPDVRAAWALRAGNPRSLNVCFIGRARWTRAEWLEHEGMLRRGAGIVRTWCRDYSIPAVKLTSAQVGANHRGVCGHVNWTEGQHDGTHWDPGPGFPWDLFMKYVKQEDGKMTDTDLLRAVYVQLTGDTDFEGPDTWGWPSHRYGGGQDLTPVDLLRAVDRELNSRFDLVNRPGPDKDTAVGHLLSLRVDHRALAARQSAFEDRTTNALGALTARLDGVKAAIDQLNAAIDQLVKAHRATS